ncbi:hypothetical protein AB0B25_21225 [Nocardia sp. NPDC049190]|uniref:hypothetical protein n=1 Tax=Nocardia sp. NPDC049190 TaxID=3155650 RepID=UPI0033DC2659
MTQWLPLLASLVVAVAALVGVLVNNRTNRAAVDAADERSRITLDAADERNRVTLDAAQRNVELTNTAAGRREHDMWRRESVLAAASSVVSTSADVRRQLLACDRWDADELDLISQDVLETISAAREFISSLRVLAHRKVPNRCEDLMRTLTAALNITVQRRRIELDSEATGEEIAEIQALWSRAIENTVEEERSVINATRVDLEIKISADLHSPTAEPTLARA